MLEGLGKAPSILSCFLQACNLHPNCSIDTHSLQSLKKCEQQLIQSILLRHRSEPCLAKMTKEQLEQTPPPEELFHFNPCNPTAQHAEQEQVFKGTPQASA